MSAMRRGEAHKAVKKHKSGKNNKKHGKRRKK
jgi:hypothetical protein